MWLVWLSIGAVLFLLIAVTDLCWSAASFLDAKTEEIRLRSEHMKEEQ